VVQSPRCTAQRGVGIFEPAVVQPRDIRIGEHADVDRWPPAGHVLDESRALYPAGARRADRRGSHVREFPSDAPCPGPYVQLIQTLLSPLQIVRPTESMSAKACPSTPVGIVRGPGRVVRRRRAHRRRGWQARPSRAMPALSQRGTAATRSARPPKVQSACPGRAFSPTRLARLDGKRSGSASTIDSRSKSNHCWRRRPHTPASPRSSRRRSADRHDGRNSLSFVERRPYANQVCT